MQLIRHDPRRYGELAFTVWELLCSLAIVAIIVSTATPAMQNVILDAKLRASVRTFVAAVQLARTEAAKRGRTVVLCQSPDLSTCGQNFDYTAGWIVFADVERERLPQRSQSERVLRADAPPFEGSILANRRAFEFRPFQKRSTNGTVTFCDRRGEDKARAVVVSYTGRPRVAKLASGRRALSCPPA